MSMLIVFPRRIVLDAAPWPGRRWLAALDAVAWPVVLAFALVIGIGQQYANPYFVAIAAGGWVCLRLYRAVFRAPAYRFTTWWVAKLVACLFAAALLWQAASALFG